MGSKNWFLTDSKVWKTKFFVKRQKSIQKKNLKVNSSNLLFNFPLMDSWYRKSRKNKVDLWFIFDFATVHQKVCNIKPQVQKDTIQFEYLKCRFQIVNFKLKIYFFFQKIFVLFFSFVDIFFKLNLCNFRIVLHS